MYLPDAWTASLEPRKHGRIERTRPNILRPFSLKEVVPQLQQSFRIPSPYHIRPQKLHKAVAYIAHCTGHNHFLQHILCIAGWRPISLFSLLWCISVSDSRFRLALTPRLSRSRTFCAAVRSFVSQRDNLEHHVTDTKHF